MRLKTEQLAEVRGRSERVAERLGVRIDGRGCDNLAVYLREEERAHGQCPAVESCQPLERALVARSAVTDEERPFAVELTRRQIPRANGSPEKG